jgi:hypothetical protein
MEIVERDEAGNVVATYVETRSGDGVARVDTVVRVTTGLRKISR